MKPTYQKPTTEELSISLAPLMSVSQTPGNVEDGFTIGEDTPETTETSGNLSRRRDIWEDDYEYEDQ